MNKFLLALTFLFVSSFAVAGPRMLPTPQPVVTTTVPTEASGYWVTNSPWGYQLVLFSGSYYVSPHWGLPGTCGNVLRVDVSVPKTYPYNASFYGTNTSSRSDGTSAPYGQVIQLLNPGKPGIVGSIRIDFYNAVNDTLTVTATSTGVGGPNGTFTLNRDLFGGRTAPVNPCP